MAFQISPGVNVSEIDLTTVVPGVSTTVGALAGVFNWGPVGETVLIDSENKLVNIFGRPTTDNAETFFSAANFLGYGTALLVARAANTTDSGVNGALNAIANTDTVNVASLAVKNRDDYDSKTTFAANSLYIAKYPGELGNSLKVSVCDSTNAYQRSLNLIGVQSSNTITGSLTIDLGSSNAVLSFNASTDAATADTYANNILNQLSIGDLITIGNSTIGTQYMKVKSIGAITTGVTNATVNVVFTETNKLLSNFVLSNTINGNSTVVNLTRNWEYFNLVDAAPGTSDWVATYGNTAAVDLMHVVVVDEGGKFGGVAGAILETFSNVSRATDAKSADGAPIYYKSVINDGSNYIWWARDRLNAVSNSAANVASSTNQKPLTLNFRGGQNGSSESNIAITSLAAAYDLYRNKESTDVSLIIAGKPRGGVGNTQLGNYIIDNITGLRKDCVVFISPDDSVVTTSTRGNEASALVTWKNDVRDSTYAFIDSGYKYMYDRYNDVYRYIPLNGDIAGLAARTEATNDAWWSPAGFNRGQIKNIVKLRFNPTQADRDLLYKNSINPVVSFPGQGTILYGDKTATTKPSAFDRLNVRRLFITLEKSISEAAKFSLFEFNDEFTRSQFRNLITPFLRDVQSRRGITDFLVVCDNTNNTAERIDRNEFWGDIYIKPNRSINFIQLNFVAVRTGVEFSTVIGRF